MTGPVSFLVEDFINSITVQLDRVQDALRLKSVNRPLTYALKDFSIDLQVFVDVDSQGNVRFRNAGPNESGASTVRLGFTTINKAMIDENTVSLAVTRSPSLDQLGLGEDERRRLEQLGVHNAAQLQNLASSTSTQTISRLTELPLDRLRLALNLGKPQVTHVGPAPSPPPVPPPVVTPPKLPVVRVGTGVPRLQLTGSRLAGDGLPVVRLNREPLSIANAEDDRLEVDLPTPPRSGALEIEMPGGEVMAYHLEFEDDQSPPDQIAGRDRWEPSEGYK